MDNSYSFSPKGGVRGGIPNTITCCNLISGCIATGCAFYGQYQWAVLMIVVGAVFDFFDGMTARALGVSSPIGKELDSLADVVTFGVAPSAIVFYLFHQVHYPQILVPFKDFIPYTAFLMAAFSALRLAKFNLDERQSTQFIGLPTPANALFWGSLVLGQHAFLVSLKFNALHAAFLHVVGLRGSHAGAKVQGPQLGEEQGKVSFPAGLLTLLPSGHQLFCCHHPLVRSPFHHCRCKGKTNTII